MPYRRKRFRMWERRGPNGLVIMDRRLSSTDTSRLVRRVHAKGKRSAQRAEATGIEAEIERSETAAKSPAAKRVAQRTLRKTGTLIDFRTVCVISTGKRLDLGRARRA